MDIASSLKASGKKVSIPSFDYFHDDGFYGGVNSLKAEDARLAGLVEREEACTFDLLLVTRYEVVLLSSQSYSPNSDVIQQFLLSICHAM